MSELATILRAARTRLERGWRARPGDPDKACMTTAIGRETGSLVHRQQAFAALAQAIPLEPYPGDGSLIAPFQARIWVWNDDPDRTLAEVLAAYDRAIAATEAASATGAT